MDYAKKLVKEYTAQALDYLNDVPDSDADRVQVNLVPEPKCIASDSSARVRCKPKTSAIC